MTRIWSSPQGDDMMTSDDDITGIVIVYSVEDRKSYELAIDRLYELRNDESGRQVAIVLVANKVDLVRTRVISEQGFSVKSRCNT